MFASDTPSPCLSPNSISSVNSNDSEVSLSHTASIQYGPIRVRVCGRPAPTLTTGRRSKHRVLVGVEAMKREKRRFKDHEAAKKLKEKRQLIEDEMNEQIKQLEDEHLHLHNHLERLHRIKQSLEEEVNHLLNAPLDDLLSPDGQDVTLFLISRSKNVDLFDETIERILNGSLNTCFNSVTHN